MIMGSGVAMKKYLVKLFPWLSAVRKRQQELQGYIRSRSLAKKDMERIFTEYFEENTWSDPASRSGVGSNLEATKSIREEIPKLLKELSVTTMLDVPCGDFHWMKTLDLQGVSYIGADIVEKLITQNQENFSDDRRAFMCLDLTQDVLPEVELILCRDALVHFSNDMIIRALSNMKKSSAEYLLTTTFPDKFENPDIVTGMWRPINLTRPPFNLPKPLRWICESMRLEGDAKKRDKRLGLWRINDIPDFKTPYHTSVG